MQKAAVEDETEARAPAQAIPIKSMAEFDERIRAAPHHKPMLIQFTAPWCRRCGTLKQEVAAAFDETLCWLTVDIGQLTDMQERFNVVQLPRFDVYCGGKTDSVESFDAKLDEVKRMLAAATAERPVLELIDDF
jgi:thioredoxin-like negative regulator of GroEL